VHVYEKTEILAMSLEETEARNDCAGEGQQQSNQQINQPALGTFNDLEASRTFRE
jgi:hypothetical protein